MVRSRYFSGTSPSAFSNGAPSCGVNEERGSFGGGGDTVDMMDVVALARKVDDKGDLSTAHVQSLAYNKCKTEISFSGRFTTRHITCAAATTHSWAIMYSVGGVSKVAQNRVHETLASVYTLLVVDSRAKFGLTDR